MLLSAKILKLETLQKRIRSDIQNVEGALGCEVPVDFSTSFEDVLLGIDLQVNHTDYITLLSRNKLRLHNELAVVDNTLKALETVLEDSEKPAPAVPTAMPAAEVMNDPVYGSGHRVSATDADGFPLRFVIKRAYVKDSFLILVSKEDRQYTPQFSSKEMSKVFNDNIRKFGLVEEN